MSKTPNLPDPLAALLGYYAPMATEHWTPEVPLLHSPRIPVLGCNTTFGYASAAELWQRQHHRPILSLQTSPLTLSEGSEVLHWLQFGQYTAQNPNAYPHLWIEQVSWLAASRMAEILASCWLDASWAPCLAVWLSDTLSAARQPYTALLAYQDEQVVGMMLLHWHGQHGQAHLWAALDGDVLLALLNYASYFFGDTVETSLPQNWPYSSHIPLQNSCFLGYVGQSLSVI